MPVNITIIREKPILQKRLNLLKHSPIELTDTVNSILSDVKKNGDTALQKYTQQFDKLVVDSVRVSPSVLKKASMNLSNELRTSIKKAAKNIKAFHKKQTPISYSITQRDGTRADLNWRPIARVGIYVPGGRYPLISTVLMNVIPAQTAGVPEIAVFSPPNSDGMPNADIMGICGLLGIKEVYSIGGAQAIGAMAFGTESIPAVAKITGPGNAYVAAAKQAVSGIVGIDMFAGPTEIVIIADESANPELVSIDLISQAEHDIDAKAILLTDSAALAASVNEILGDQLDKISTRDTAKKSLDENGFIYIADSIDECIDISNLIAPEHLSIQTKSSENILSQVVAGAIFIGESTSVAWGDYWAGPNHTLPTSGQARYRGPLTVMDFMVPFSVIDARNSLSQSSTFVQDLADAEGLHAHSLSVKMRENIYVDS